MFETPRSSLVRRLVQIALGGASLTLAACNECSTSEVVASKNIKVSAEVACSLQGSYYYNHGSNYDCPAICGKGFNSCYVSDSAFQSAYQTNYNAADGGAPICPKLDQVNVVCQQVEHGTQLQMDGCVVEGRRPGGLVDASIDSSDPLAGYLSKAAYLEAASVIAFERLAAELTYHRAPKRLIAWAARAADEEREHAAAVGELAARFGGTREVPVVGPYRARPLFEIALENVVEGEVRETYGALVALHRAECAGDAGIRERMKKIAVEECSHAAFSHELGAWLERKLSMAERAELAAARDEALRELREELSVTPDELLVARAGVPRMSVARSMLTRLERDVLKIAA